MKIRLKFDLANAYTRLLDLRSDLEKGKRNFSRILRVFLNVRSLRIVTRIANKIKRLDGAGEFRVRHVSVYLLLSPFIFS